MSLWESISSWTSVTWCLYHLNWNATDSSGNASDGTATNVTWVGGKLWSWAWGFNWTSSLITLPSTSWLKPTWAFTATLRVKTSFSGIQVFFQVYSQVTSVAWFQIMTNTSSYVRFVVGRNTNFTLWSWYQEAIWPTAVNDWNRHHIACVYTGSQIIVYQDWVAGTAVSWSLWLAYRATSYPRLWCANRTWTDDSRCSGELDEVVLEQVSSTATEIAKKYTYAKWLYAIL